MRSISSIAVLLAAVLASCAAPSQRVTLNRSTIENVRKGIRRNKPEYAAAYNRLIKEAEAALNRLGAE